MGWGKRGVTMLRSNIDRGFHRLGLLCAVVPAALAAVFFVDAVLSYFSPTFGGSPMEFGLFGGFFALVVAPLVYAFFRGIGWIVSGFAGK